MSVALGLALILVAVAVLAAVVWVRRVVWRQLDDTGEALDDLRTIYAASEERRATLVDALERLETTMATMDATAHLAAAGTWPVAGEPASVAPAFDFVHVAHEVLLEAVDRRTIDRELQQLLEGA